MALIYSNHSHHGRNKTLLGLGFFILISPRLDQSYLHQDFEPNSLSGHIHFSNLNILILLRLLIILRSDLPYQSVLDQGSADLNQVAHNNWNSQWFQNYTTEPKTTPYSAHTNILGPNRNILRYLKGLTESKPKLILKICKLTIVCYLYKSNKNDFFSYDSCYKATCIWRISQHVSLPNLRQNFNTVNCYM